MVIIIGAGLAGLTCAKVLHGAGVEFILLEGSRAVGGRVATTVTPDGFHLDYGFQVVLDSYPAIRRHVDLEKLTPGYFESGGILVDGEKRSRVFHALHHPSRIWESATGKYATWTDKFLLGKLVTELILASPEKLLSQDRLRISTRAFLEKRGFSSFIMESFFRPFFGGVLLDNELTTSASLFQYYFQRFIFGCAFIPAGGIAELPRQLAAHLPAASIRLDSRVARLMKKSVRLQSGETLSADHIVLAAAAPEAARLLERTAPPPARCVSVCYFQSAEPLYPEKLLVLPAGKQRLVRHFAQVTNVAPALAPKGRYLLSATVLQRETLDDAALLSRAQAEIAENYPAAAALLKPLRVIDVPYAVPAQPARYTLQRTIISTDPNVSIAGDHTLHGSIQGAMESGERAAAGILEKA